MSPRIDGPWFPCFVRAGILLAVDLGWRLSVMTPQQGSWDIVVGVAADFLWLAPVILLSHLLRLRRSGTAAAFERAFDLAVLTIFFIAYVHYRHFSSMPVAKALSEGYESVALKIFFDHLWSDPRVIWFVVGPFLLLYFLLGVSNVRTNLTRRQAFSAGAAALVFGSLTPFLSPRYCEAGQVDRSWLALPAVDIVGCSIERENLSQRERAEALRSLTDGRGEWKSLDYPLYRRQTFGDPESGRKPNIVILLLESFDVHGAKRLAPDDSITPFFDSLARQGLYFPNGLSLVNRTSASVAATMCSMWLPEEAIDLIVPLGAKCLPEILKKLKNYARSYWFHSGFMEKASLRTNIERLGFDVVYSADNLPPSIPRDVERGMVPDRSFLEFVAEELSRASEPFLAVVLTSNAHPPYGFEVFGNPRHRGDAAGGLSVETNRLLDLLWYTDQSLKGFFDAYTADRGKLEKTLFVIAPDHALRDTSVKMPQSPGAPPIESHRIPFLFYQPGAIASEIRGDPVAHFDIAPTLLTVSGVTLDHAFVGTNLLAGKSAAGARSIPGVGLLGLGERAFYIKENEIDVAAFSPDGSPLKRESVDSAERERLFRRQRDWAHSYDLLMKDERLWP